VNLPTIEQFESGAVDVEAFDHEAHIYLAWSYLARCDLLESIRRYREALRRLTRKVGAEAKYHETITWFYLVSIAERRASAPGAEWTEFRRDNAELFAPAGAWLRRHYSEVRLQSALARTSFVLPDRASPEGVGALSAA
jgi:hypothetical protein